jgi:hypothetical protein
MFDTQSFAQALHRDYTGKTRVLTRVLHTVGNVVHVIEDVPIKAGPPRRAYCVHCNDTVYDLRYMFIEVPLTYQALPYRYEFYKDMEPTDERPEDLWDLVMRQPSTGTLHSPGDGYHLTPLLIFDLYHPEYVWTVNQADSSTAVLAHYRQLCELTGLDAHTIYQEVYDDNPYTHWDDTWMCARAATLADVSAVISDLEQVNYISLAERMKELWSSYIKSSPSSDS